MSEAGSEQLAQLGRLVDRLSAEYAEERRLEKELKSVQDRIRALRELDIPTLMLGVGLKEAHTTGDLHVKLREEVRASWPKEVARRQKAVAWLDANGHGGLVKRTATIRFGVGEQELRDEYVKLLRKMPKVHSRLQEDHKVEPQTLLAFLRSLRAEGAEGAQQILDLCGGHVQNFAEVK